MENTMHQIKTVSVNAEGALNLYSEYVRNIEGAKYGLIRAIIIEHEHNISWEPIKKQSSIEFANNGLVFFSFSSDVRDLVESDYLTNHLSIKKIDPDVYFFEDTGHADHERVISELVKSGICVITSRKKTSDECSNVELVSK